MTTENVESRIELPPPRFENLGPRIIAGLRGRFDASTRGDIPQQWAQFAPQMDAAVPTRVGRAAFGVCFILPAGQGFDYVSGVEVADDSNLPAGWIGLRVPALRYAVFRHEGDLASLPKTLDAIWHQWLPASHGELAAGGEGGGDVPAFFERYDEEFNPHTGTGGIEVWIPLKT
jgi:AraC family transcriptional regulator